MGKPTFPASNGGSWLIARVEPAWRNQRLVRFGLLFVPIVAIAVIVGLEPLFLADPPRRLALIVGIAVFGFLLLRHPEVFFGLWMAGVVNVFLSFYPSAGAIHGWRLIPLAGILFYVVRRKERFFPFGILLLSQIAFLVVLCIGVAYSSDADYGRTKAWQFLLVNLLAFIGPMLFADDFGRVRNILLSFAIGTILFALSGLYFFHSGVTEYLHRVTAFTFQPIGFGQVCGIASSVLLCIIFTSRTNRRWLLLPILLLVVYVTVLTGTRGALVALIVAVVVLGILRVRKHPTSAIVGACIAAVALLLAFHYAPSGYTERYFATGETLLQEDRLNLWESGYQMFLRSPLIGRGTGAFHEYMGGWVRYPHNIFIEIGAELGLVGLGVFVAFLLLTLKSAMKVILAPLYDDDVKQMMLILLICFTFCLVAAQFSLDINGNSNIWLFSGLIWAVSLAVTPRNMTTRRFATEGEESGKKVGWH